MFYGEEMIYSRWHKRQRFGNWLWQYAVSRIVAEELGYTLDSPVISQFPNTMKKVIGKEYTKPVYGMHYKNLNQYKELSKSGAKLVFNASLCPCPFIEKYRNAIRDEWFNVVNPYGENFHLLDGHFCVRKNGQFENIQIDGIEKNDVVMNIRMGDFLSKKHLWRYCGVSYFDFILSSMDFNRLFIVSDDVKSELLNGLSEKYNAIHYVSKGMMEDVNFIKLFDSILISHSTFSWWAAYLSNASIIYLPIVNNSRPAINEFDNMVNEDRYTYVDRDNLKILGNYSEARKTCLRN